MGNNVTMRDIARKLGISTVTVSKAINDKEGVGEELKSRIKELADELGYRMNTSAKAMKEGRSYNIGVIVAELYTEEAQEEQGFYMRFYHYISKVLEDHLYSGILHILSRGDEEQLVLPRIYHEKKVDGFIILGQVSDAYVEKFHQTGVPMVFLDFYTDRPEVDCVISDNFYGVYESTNLLIRSGHRDIAFVGSLYSTSSIQDRFLGYYKSLLEHRIPLKDHYIIQDRDESGHYIEMTLPDPLPTAFVCNCDQVAYHLLKLLNEKGVNVPDDCSIVGFDNDIYSTIAQPNLTTVEVNMEEMAGAAVEIIVNKVNNNQVKYGRVLVKGKLIYRDSVKNISTNRK